MLAMSRPDARHASQGATVCLAADRAVRRMPCVVFGFGAGPEEKAGGRADRVDWFSPVKTRLSPHVLPASGGVAEEGGGAVDSVHEFSVGQGQEEHQD